MVLGKTLQKHLKLVELDLFTSSIFNNYFPFLPQCFGALHIGGRWVFEDRRCFEKEGRSTTKPRAQESHQGCVLTGCDCFG